MRSFSIFIGGFLAGTLFFWPGSALAQAEETLKIDSLLQKADISFVPRTGTFTEGSTFDIPIMLDTHGQSINALELYINFDADKLQVIESTGQQSIVGIWLAAPTYSNVSGTLKIIGAIPGGINTQSGLIGKITFKAINTGSARVTFAPASRVLSNDGLGTTVITSLGLGTYSLIPPAPEGPRVFSETHPFTDKWYNNNTPVLAWEENASVSAYSFIVDDKPFTVPSNEASTVENRVSLPDLPNGLNYFHLKAKKNGIWGGTTHFLLRIDNLPPAPFSATYEKLFSTDGGRVYVSFQTTDSLSGIDHYEVGVLDPREGPDVVPVFIEAKSPYQLPVTASGDFRVVVRAVDRGGNSSNHNLEISGNFITGFLQKNFMTGVAAVLFIIILWLIYAHYRFQRRVVRALQLERVKGEALSPPAYHLPAAPALNAPVRPEVVTYKKIPSPFI